MLEVLAVQDGGGDVRSSQSHLQFDRNISPEKADLEVVVIRLTQSRMLAAT